MKPIKLNHNVIKPLLWLSQFFNENTFLIVCKGYDEDIENYTGIYYEDDIDVFDPNYSDFQLWIN